MKKLMFGLLGALALAAQGAPAKKAQEKLGTEAELKPLLGHIVQPRTAIDLCGEWDYAKVKCTAEKYPDPKNPEKQLTRWNRTDVTDFSALKWEKVVLPWGMRAMSGQEYHYFRRTVELPQDVAGKRVLFKAEYIMDTYSLIVNGVRFPSVSPFEMPWSNDITSAVKPGANEIVIEVSNDFGRRAWKDSPFQHQWALAGYWGVARPVHLEIINPVAILYTAVWTKVTPEKVFTARVTVTNTTDKAVEVVLSGSVESGEWRVESGVVQIPAKGSKEIVLEWKWHDAKLWDPEHPNLYYATFQLSTLNSQHLLDAYRVRFGFREISIKGHQFLVNGKPYIHRRTTHVMDGNDARDESLKKAILTLRENGVTGMRLFGRNWVRLAHVADEVGAFITPVNPGGGGAAGKSPLFWKVYAEYQAHLARELMNHPSIFAWGLGNEFGTLYSGEEGERVKAAAEQQAILGKKIEAIDPTRPWTYCGEVDAGYPVRGHVGPAPIRSFHYPIGTCKDGVTFPESGYWYDKGELSWQRISTKDKPLVISEDIYHGTTDQFVGMAKTGGDAIYTLDGYAKTLHRIIRYMAEGYYHAGLGGWETWVTFQHRGERNMLNRLGPLMPHYLITMRENFPNLRGGETAERNVFCYNQLFTPYDCELVREDWFDGEKVFEETRKFRLDQGMKHHEKIAIDAPRVKKPSKYEVKFKLLGRNNETSELRNSTSQLSTLNTQLLTSRTYTYTVFPKKTEIEVEGKTALLASGKSVLAKMDFPRGVFATVDAVLASGAKAIVVDKVLSDDDGRKLNDFVLAGGKVLLVEAAETSWTPLMIEFRRPFSFAWRRNDERMKDVDESWLHAWMPDHTLGDASYPKPAADTRVLWDCGQRDGLSNAPIFWLMRGKGAWMLCQLPVLSRFAIEPAAPHVLQSVMDEFTDDAPELTGKVVAAPGGTADGLLQTMKIETSRKTPDRNDVLVLDASKGLGGEQLIALDAHTKNRGTVVLLEPQPGENDELLARLGLKLTPFDKETAFVWGSTREVDRTPKWLVRKGNAGLLAGITSEDMFWFGTKAMEPYLMKLMCNDTNAWFSVGAQKPIVSGRLEALPGADVELLTDPAGIAVSKLNRGKVVVLTLRFNALAATYPARATRLLRTILNNLGAATVSPKRVYNYQFIDISKSFNRGLWNDPLYQKADGSFDPVGWFGTENDMRFFPVNLCGWSMAARNYCPKEAFPTEPLNLGGFKFLLSDPAKNKGRGCLVLKPGESVRLDMPKSLKARRFIFLGSQSWTESGPMLEMRVPGVKEPVVFNGYGEDFGVYRWTVSVKKGSVAWVGETLKDDQAALYNWSGVNPAPEKAVPWIELKSTAKKDSIAVIAVTAELADE